MRFIQKFFQSKKLVEDYIKENGVEEAVKEYGINKICMYKFLESYKGTELYPDGCPYGESVYNKKGQLLGITTNLMSPYYKKLGHFFGPCLNGNIILSTIDQESLSKTYAVFDKSGNQLVPYSKYFNYCFMPKMVVLMDKTYETENNAVTISYSGNIKNQIYTYIEKVDRFDRVYNAYVKNGDGFKKVDIIASEDFDEDTQE
ncbi:MAG: hypothetical protein IJ415_04390 [Clostridia bacterium]|nr:hypothetical protein [Clostridia bacterium]